MIDAGVMIVKDAGGAGWLAFRKPLRQVAARRAEDIPEALDRIKEATAAGHYAAGWISYEAAPGLDATLKVRTPEGADADEAPHASKSRAQQPAKDSPHRLLPLLWFGIYRQPEPLAALPDPGAAGYTLTPWEPALSREEYGPKVERIRELIAAGDTYQVNFTFPFSARFDGEPWALFHALDRAQRGRHHAFIMTARHAIISASPELFFVQQGDRVTTRPMKGTRPRGRWLEDDARLAAELTASAKDRAENVMIVDLLRNDLSRVARPGSVRAEPLFEIERLETVLQMTSTIEAETDAHPIETLRALFPCGSVTGAPKIHTMKLITELEDDPRGIYTGAIGWIGPERRAQFSVAIRTVQLDRKTGVAVFGVGSGVTADSSPGGEYDECLSKARILEPYRPVFELFETMRWDPDEGLAYFVRHLNRLESSARYFGFPFDRDAIRGRVHEWAAGLPDALLRVRLRLNPQGEAHLESAPISEGSFGRAAAAGPLRIGIARTPIHSSDVFLYHKTTQRECYHRARAERPDCDDVILINERGELTESSIANLVVELDDRRYTPPRESGLLAGTMREELLEKCEIAERVLKPAELEPATAIWLINSVRGWMPAKLI